MWRSPAGYALFQTANNTTVLANIAPHERGLLSGLLNLSRNLGLITGASVMGAVFTIAAVTNDLATAPPAAVAAGMRITFAVAATLIGVALVVTVGPLQRAPGAPPFLPLRSRQPEPADKAASRAM